MRLRTSTAVARLRASAANAPAETFRAADLAGLPAPVARYFEAALREGRTLPRYARLRQIGTFLVKPASNRWGPFDATHHMTGRPAGFVWDARIRMAPGLNVRVRDSLLGGRGSMVGTLLGFIPVVRMEGTPEIAAGSMQRYLAEAVWCPSALLPSAGVIWSALGDASARASLTLGATTVTLDFHFGEDGLVRSVFTAARPRTEGRRSVPTPWQGRWSRYEEHGGIVVPVEGEVEWVLPTGPQPYWRGRVTDIAYDGAAVP